MSCKIYELKEKVDVELEWLSLLDDNVLIQLTTLFLDKCI